jgi:3',5'-nucleoside bisphosphate phosphatase
MPPIDLHAHTTGSDGTFTPEELVAHAAGIGLEAIAITDHDTTVSIPAALAAGTVHNIHIVPGIEVSCNPKPLRLLADPSLADAAPRKWGTLHILGLYVQHDAPSLAAIRTRALATRAGRNPQIVARLQSLGIDLDYSQVLAIARRTGTQVVGRPHIAQALMEIGVVSSINEAFDKFIGEGRPAHIRQDLTTCQEAIDAIHAAGGVASLAHAIQLRAPDDAQLSLVVQHLADAGLDALELLHPDHTPDYARHLDDLASRFNLLRTAGSDFHGTRKAVALGSQNGPSAWLAPLKERAALRPMSNVLRQNKETRSL